MTRPTIYDVAQQAGVSAATVSNVINTPTKVNENTRKRVMEAIDQLHYTPLDSHTRSRKSYNSIGVVGMFTTYASFYTRLAGVLDVLRQHHFKTVLYDQKDPQREGEHLAKLPITGHLDGLIVMYLPLSEQVADRL